MNPIVEKELTLQQPSMQPVSPVGEGSRHGDSNDDGTLDLEDLGTYIRR